MFSKLYLVPSGILLSIDLYNIGYIFVIEVKCSKIFSTEESSKKLLGPLSLLCKNLKNFALQFISDLKICAFLQLRHKISRGKVK